MCLLHIICEQVPPNLSVENNKKKWCQHLQWWVGGHMYVYILLSINFWLCIILWKFFVQAICPECIHRSIIFSYYYILCVSYLALKLLVPAWECMLLKLWNSIIRAPRDMHTYLYMHIESIYYSCRWSVSILNAGWVRVHLVSHLRKQKGVPLHRLQWTSCPSVHDIKI